MQPDGQTLSGVSLAANYFPGSWANGSTEPMYANYIYAYPGQSGTLTFNGLPTGTYSVYAYTFDGNFTLTVGGVSQGTQTTTYNYPTINPPPWIAGTHYALWSNVGVTAGQPMVLTVLPGLHDGYAVISGVQIAYSGTSPSITLSGLTNGTTIGGVVTLPVEVAGPSGNITVISLEDSGVPVASYLPPFQLPAPLLEFDTTELTNGVHNISAYAMVINPGTGLEDGSQIIYEGESVTNTVTVYNEISFPNWMGTFGELSNSLAVVAFSGHANAQWQLDTYGSRSGYIGSFVGTTPDGNIDVEWNLLGPNGVLHTDPSFTFNLTTVHAEGLQRVQTTKPTPPTYRITDTWPARGGWVIANQQAWQTCVGAAELDTATDGFVSIAQGLGLPVSPATSDPSSGEAYRIPFGTGNPNAPAAWAAFRAAIYNATNRNLFYLGHGDPTGIGASMSTNRFIPATEIGAILGTMPLTSAPHKYRFVYLDGCSTASGHLPEAFGIIKKQNVDSAIMQTQASARPLLRGGRRTRLLDLCTIQSLLTTLILSKTSKPSGQTDTVRMTRF